MSKLFFLFFPRLLLFPFLCVVFVQWYLSHPEFISHKYFFSEFLFARKGLSIHPIFFFFWDSSSFSHRQKKPESFKTQNRYIYMFISYSSSAGGRGGGLKSEDARLHRLHPPFSFRRRRRRHEDDDDEDGKQQWFFLFVRSFLRAC